MTPDISCIITGHKEGHLSVASLRSFWAAIEFAQAQGLNIQPLLILDRPNARTQALFEQQSKTKVHVFDFGDQGQARNAGVALAKGTYTAFLDADDLWTEDWLVQAFTFLKDMPKTHIAHPEFNYFFEMQATIFCQIDQESDEFDIDLLRVSNYWDALCLCPTEIYREFPFYTRDLGNGWAYEDWFWNCQTVAGGKIHKIVPNSVLFKRRQETSQTINASRNKSMIKGNALSSYDCSLY